MFFDYHLHSQFSPDSLITMTDICTQALKIGLEEIAITDHLDIDYQDPRTIFEFSRPEYIDTLEAFQEKYRGRLRVKKGLELGLQPHILEECTEFVGDHFDFVLGSFHTCQKKDLYNGQFFKGYTQWQAYREYLKDMLYCAQNFDQFSVLGHVDVIRRYGGFSEVPDLTEDMDCTNLLEEIFKTIIQKGKGIEVNTSGYKIDSTTDPMPTIPILKLYRELGGEIITTGSDSHIIDQVGYKITEVHTLLKDLGFKYLTTFEGGKPVFHVI